MKQEGSIISKPLDPFKKSPLALIKPEGAKKSSTPEEPQPGPSGSGCQTNMTEESKCDSTLAGLALQTNTTSIHSSYIRSRTCTCTRKLSDLLLLLLLYYCSPSNHSFVRPFSLSLTHSLTHSHTDKSKLPAFWLPSLTPDDKGKLVKKPETKVLCPMTKKPLSMKHLITGEHRLRCVCSVASVKRPLLLRAVFLRHPLSIL